MLLQLHGGGTDTKISQHRKLKILLLLLHGFEPVTFQSQVWHSNCWAIPTPRLTDWPEDSRWADGRQRSRVYSHPLLRFCCCPTAISLTVQWIVLETCAMTMTPTWPLRETTMSSCSRLPTTCCHSWTQYGRNQVKPDNHYNSSCHFCSAVFPRWEWVHSALQDQPKRIYKTSKIINVKVMLYSSQTTHTCTDTHTQTHTHTHTHTHACMYTQACMHIVYMHTHTHAHTHVRLCFCVMYVSLFQYFFGASL